MVQAHYRPQLKLVTMAKNKKSKPKEQPSITWKIKCEPNMCSLRQCPCYNPNLYGCVGAVQCDGEFVTVSNDKSKIDIGL